MKKILLAFATVLALTATASAQFVYPTVNQLPYPGTVTTTLDGDLIRVNCSVIIPGAIPEIHYQEWGPNPTSGLEEVWSSNAIMYVGASYLPTNAGIDPHNPQIRIPMQQVQHLRTDGTCCASQYLGSVKGDTLFTNGRKFGFTNHWNIKLYFMEKLTPDGMNWNAYSTGWIPVNIASLPAMDSGTFYAGTIFNPTQPAQPAGGGNKGKSGEKKK